MKAAAAARSTRKYRLRGLMSGGAVRLPEDNERGKSDKAAPINRERDESFLAGIIVIVLAFSSVPVA